MICNDKMIEIIESAGHALYVQEYIRCDDHAEGRSCSQMVGPWVTPSIWDMIHVPGRLIQPVIVPNVSFYLTFILNVGGNDLESFEAQKYR